MNNWRKPGFFAAGALVIALLIGGAYYIGLNRAQPTQTPSSDQPKPQAMALRPTNAPTPTIITTLPTSSDASLFKNPGEPAYVPGKGFAPDAQRILDLTSLQISIEKYRVARGRYPAQLTDLFPDFAPKDENDRGLSAPPVDPATRQPYTFSVAGDRLSYQLVATLSSGKQYTLPK